MTVCFLCGDVMTGRGIDQILARPVEPTLHEPYVKDARRYVELAEQKHGPLRYPVPDGYIWGVALEVLDRLRPAARLVNLETAVTGSDTFWEGKGIHYRMSPANLGCLTAAGLDCCTLANNHVLDWGYAGLEETLTTLHRAGLKTAGAGQDETAATAPAVLAAGTGNRLLVFSLASSDSGVPPAWAAAGDRPGVGFLPDLSDAVFSQLAARIAGARRHPGDLVMVSVHWGGNWGYTVPFDQRAFAHRLIDEAGVDLVHGHSSHHVKGLEVHRGRLILYGCGDLITDYEGIGGRESFRGDLGLMYFPEFDPGRRRLKSLRMQPTQMRQLRLCHPSGKDVAWMEATLNREGRRFGNRVQLQQDGMLHLQWQEEHR